jgi:hypothetical protein
MTDLTQRQKATIDRLLIEHPTITPTDVRSHYEHYYFARNWFVWIEIEPNHYNFDTTITRCDHSYTAAVKAQAIRRYIEERQAAQS